MDTLSISKDCLELRKQFERSESLITNVNDVQSNVVNELGFIHIPKTAGAYLDFVIGIRRYSMANVDPDLMHIVRKILDARVLLGMSHCATFLRTLL